MAFDSPLIQNLNVLLTNNNKVRIHCEVNCNIRLVLYYVLLFLFCLVYID